MISQKLELETDEICSVRFDFCARIGEHRRMRTSILGEDDVQPAGSLLNMPHLTFENLLQDFLGDETSNEGAISG